MEQTRIDFGTSFLIDDNGDVGPGDYTPSIEISGVRSTITSNGNVHGRVGLPFESITPTTERGGVFLRDRHPYIPAHCPKTAEAIENASTSLPDPTRSQPTINWDCCSYIPAWCKTVSAHCPKIAEAIENASTSLVRSAKTPKVIKCQRGVRGKALHLRIFDDPFMERARIAKSLVSNVVSLIGVNADVGPGGYTPGMKISRVRSTITSNWNVHGGVGLPFESITPTTEKGGCFLQLRESTWPWISLSFSFPLTVKRATLAQVLHGAGQLPSRGIGHYMLIIMAMASVVSASPGNAAPVSTQLQIHQANHTPFSLLSGRLLHAFPAITFFSSCTWGFAWLNLKINPSTNLESLVIVFALWLFSTVIYGGIQMERWRTAVGQLYMFLTLILAVCFTIQNEPQTFVSVFPLSITISAFFVSGIPNFPQWILYILESLGGIVARAARPQAREPHALQNDSNREHELQRGQGVGNLSILVDVERGSPHRVENPVSAQSTASNTEHAQSTLPSLMHGGVLAYGNEISSRMVHLPVASYTPSQSS